MKFEANSEPSDISELKQPETQFDDLDLEDIILSDLFLPEDISTSIMLLQNEVYGFKNDSAVGLRNVYFERAILEHQIKTKVSDPKMIERDLELLIKGNVFRRFKMKVDKKEYFSIVETETYLQTAKFKMKTTILAFQENNDSNEKLSVPSPIEFFAILVQTFKSMFVSYENLKFLWLFKCGALKICDRSSDGETAEKLTQHACLLLDKTMNIFVLEGFMILYDDKLKGFWFTSPLTRTIAKNLDLGRKELLREFNFSRFREKREADLLKKRLRNSDLSVRFVLIDLEGCKMVKRLDTTAGVIFKRPCKKLF
eukprot:CAMPEP_0171470522 /NCGR_PEP_ID=MMETSP0946-20130122/197_1 /TAXON_ID=109269 /ORGANISM="Vaucheria litorea, Strain CCMP2940" /LENGTH=311 /DNA_ID=CAMNT_0011999913 /DNA_START=114 /DNA_END=1049 /DNA_ORIENTATION=+